MQILEMKQNKTTVETKYRLSESGEESVLIESEEHDTKQMRRKDEFASGPGHIDLKKYDQYSILSNEYL